MLSIKFLALSLRPLHLADGARLPLLHDAPFQPLKGQKWAILWFAQRAILDSSLACQVKRKLHSHLQVGAADTLQTFLVRITPTMAGKEAVTSATIETQASDDGEWACVFCCMHTTALLDLPRTSEWLDSDVPSVLLAKLNRYSPVFSAERCGGMSKMAKFFLRCVEGRLTACSLSPLGYLRGF
eukprot:SAG31_NODE_6748_length_1901_cov_5.280799_3_plen_184_part_00